MAASHYQCLVACLTQCTVDAFSRNLGGLEVLRFPFCCTFLSSGLSRDPGGGIARAPLRLDTELET